MSFADGDHTGASTCAEIAQKGHELRSMFWLKEREREREHFAVAKTVHYLDRCLNSAMILINSQQANLGTYGDQVARTASTLISLRIRKAG